MPAAHVMRWRDGLIVYFKAYRQREAALDDLAHGRFEGAAVLTVA